MGARLLYQRPQRPAGGWTPSPSRLKLGRHVLDAARVADRLWSGRPARIEPLAGGITNQNFKVTVGEDVFVLRIGGRDTHLLGIDRRAEHEAGTMAAAVGVGPEVVAWVQPEGWLVTRFIEGRAMAPEDLRGPETIARVARALLRLHSGPPIPGRFDAHRVVEDYCRTAVERDVEIPSEYSWALAISHRIEGARGPRPLVPCHNDLLAANLIDDGEIRIVDWDYAGMGDRFFDLGNFTVNQELGSAGIDALLDSYFGAVRGADAASLRLMTFMSDFREAMWGVVQQGISDLDFDFRAYAASHFARLQRTAARPGFEADLSACAAG
jgi:thiamine kinase-like enzyme